jgi:hypothetical protein
VDQWLTQSTISPGQKLSLAPGIDMLSRAAWVTLPVALLVAGCQLAPSRADLVGRWKATKYPKTLDLSATVLQLNSDGTFRGWSLPGMLVGVGSPSDRAVFDGAGKWTLDRIDGELGVVLTFEHATAPNVRNAEIAIYRTVFDFYLFHNSDPDLGPEVIYTKGG